MTREQELVLLERYPELFDREALPWDRTTGFTLQVDAAGWFDLIDNMCRRLTGIGGCIIHEMKEKVGELRVTCGGADDAVKHEIQMAQEQSRTTCQVCGGYGQLRMFPESLVATLCETCEAQLEQKLVKGI